MSKIYSLRFTPVEVEASKNTMDSAVDEAQQREDYIVNMLAKISCDKIGEVLFEDEEAASISAKLRIESIMEVYSIEHPIMEYTLEEREVI